VSAPRRKILAVDELRAAREEHRRQGDVVVQCHGCFDIVHPGHIRYLQFAKEQGDVLIVSVSSDRTVGKGVNRPYINEELRLENLAALEIVDYVCLDDHDWAGPILEVIQPDVYVKGKEYETSADPRFLKERALVEQYGGSVIFSSGEVVYSSTFILEQFRHRFQLETEKIRAFCRRHGIDRSAIGRLLEGAQDLRVLVIGDPVLDCYIHCDSLGVASESPVLDVTPMREDWYLGAGGLIAAQASALGARSAFLSVLGDSPDEERFRQHLERFGIEPILVGEDRPIYRKTRYLVEDSKVFKINSGRYAPLSTAATSRVARELEQRGAAFDAWVVSDFGYGLFGQELIEAVAGLSQRLGVPYFFDVSHQGAGSLLKFHQAALATPTEEELRFAFGDRESGLSNLASRYYRETDAQRLVVTLGKRGVVLFDPPEEGTARLVSDYLPAMETQPIDTVGAGDVFLATTTLACLAGGSTAAGVYLGSCVSGLAVRQLGNEPVDRIDLERWLEGRPELD